jgi:hypothetical protein
MSDENNDQPKETSITEIESALQFMWNNFKTEPGITNMSLGNYRNLATANGISNEFLEITSELPASTVVQLSEAGPKLVTDEDGHLLEFA